MRMSEPESEATSSGRRPGEIESVGTITRRTFLGSAGILSAVGTLARPAGDKAVHASDWAGGEVGNATFRLTLSPREGLRKTRLLHAPSGLLLADDYHYTFGQPRFPESSISEASDGWTTVWLRGTVPGSELQVAHEFRVARDQPWMEEQITVTNSGSIPLDLESGRCGFVLELSLVDGQVPGNWGAFKFIAIPYRREPEGDRDQYADFSLGQVVNAQYSSELWTHETTVTPAYASEGWAWTNGELGFLLTKYSQEGMEWSLLDRMPLEGGRAGLRWGGCGNYRGDPERGAWLAPGESHRFGVTRVTAYEGGMAEGFYTFREEMSARGHGCPAGFDPPVHWNELYDNRLWWLPDEQQNNPEMRKRYYTLADMKDEAAKAKAIGCEALYMDPGWDTSFASKLWDETRLGSYKSFTEMLRRDYGLKSSLHTPLSGWCDPSSYSPEAHRLDRFGRRLTWSKQRGFEASTLCGASRQYVDETARRLKMLARDGAAYFMFDGTMYHGECWDREHGHRVPARREEHVQSLCRLARMVHAEYPHVLIEMHDPVVGGQNIRYAPTYYGHGRASDSESSTAALGFDSVWAFELMWMPMDDLLSGRAVALYYYNLAYGLPLYIHIDLRTDNENALVFWWNASTCRHLGIGGTSKDPATRKAHQDAMATYRRMDTFYKAGAFYGIDEMTHVHVHPREPAAVVNCFNTEDRPVRREVEFAPEKCGLDGRRSYTIRGVTARPTSRGYIMVVDLPALGHRLAEVAAS